MRKTVMFSILLPLTFAVSVRADSPVMTNALIYVDHFLLSGQTVLVGDVMSIKTDSLKLRINGNTFDYSGHFSIILNTPREHKNPYWGFGSPETAKFVVLNDCLKGATDARMILTDATIWEKSDGYID